MAKLAKTLAVFLGIFRREKIKVGPALRIVISLCALRVLATAPEKAVFTFALGQ